MFKLKERCRLDGGWYRIDCLCLCLRLRLRLCHSVDTACNCRTMHRDRKLTVALSEAIREAEVVLAQVPERQCYDETDEEKKGQPLEGERSYGEISSSSPPARVEGIVNGC